MTTTTDHPLPSVSMTAQDWVDQAGWLLLKHDPDSWDAIDQLASYLRFVWGSNPGLARVDHRLGHGLTDKQIHRLLERAKRTAERHTKGAA